MAVRVRCMMLFFLAFTNTDADTNTKTDTDKDRERERHNDASSGAQFGRPNSFNYGSGPGPSKQARLQDKTIEKEVPVGLEEIAKGAEKKMKISRRIQHDDGRVTNEEKVLKITIKPGWKAGTKVTF